MAHNVKKQSKKTEWNEVFPPTASSNFVNQKPNILSSQSNVTEITVLGLEKIKLIKKTTTIGKNETVFSFKILSLTLCP